MDYSLNMEAREMTIKLSDIRDLQAPGVLQGGFVEYEYGTLKDGSDVHWRHDKTDGSERWYYLPVTRQRKGVMPWNVPMSEWLPLTVEK